MGEAMGEWWGTARARATATVTSRDDMELQPRQLVLGASATAAASCGYSAAYRLSDIMSALKTSSTGSAPPFKTKPEAEAKPSLLFHMGDDNNINNNNNNNNNGKNKKKQRKMKGEGEGQGIRKRKRAIIRPEEAASKLSIATTTTSGGGGGGGSGGSGSGSGGGGVELVVDRSRMSKREIHIYSERQRRQGMTHLYTILSSLLPHSTSKTDRCSILTETITEIESLKQKMKVLEAKRAQISLSITQISSSSSSPPPLSSSYSASSSSSSFISTSSSSNDGQQDDSVCVSESKGKSFMVPADEVDVAVRISKRDVFITARVPKRKEKEEEKGIWSTILQVLRDDHSLEVLNVTLSTSSNSNFHCIHAQHAQEACNDNSNATLTTSKDIQAKLHALLLVPSS